MSRFIDLWTRPDDAPARVSSDALEGVELRLQTQLPRDYRNAILECGLPRPTIDLLDVICARELDLHDVSDFLDPDEMVEVTDGWRDLGLPEELFAFATDSMGNLFCFASDAKDGEVRPVFFWDHDTREVDIVAPSFASWIESLCSVAPN